MALNPSEMIKFVEVGRVEVNSIDLFPEKIWSVKGTVMLKEKTSHPKLFEVLDWKERALDPGTYRVRFKGLFECPENTVGMIWPRSSLARNGIDIMAGLVDSGFIGELEVGLRIPENVSLWIGNEAIATLIYFRAETDRKYSGQYRKFLVMKNDGTRTVLPNVSGTGGITF